MINLISVIVPCYNQAQYLSEALQSVLDQTYPNWECIIINDGSPDNTEEIAQKWLKKDFRFKYVYKENGGLSSARNAGLEIAKGDYIQFLDADDILNKYKFELSLTKLQKSTPAIVITDFNMFFNSIDNLQEPFCNLKEDYFNFEKLLFGWDYEFNIPIHCGFFEISLFRGFIFFEELKAKEDWLMWLSILKKEPQVFFINSSLAYYRLHQNSMTKDIKHMGVNSLAVINHLKMIVSEEIFIDYLCFALEKKQFEINRLNLKILKIQNSRGFKWLEKIRCNIILKFILKKIM